jgi:hypothetical protein
LTNRKEIKLAIVRLEREYVPEINRADNEGYAPIHHACREGDSTEVHKLIVKGADVNLTVRRVTDSGSWEGTTPLMLVAKAGHLAALEVLLKFDPDSFAVDAFEKTCFDYAFEYNRPCLAILGNWFDRKHCTARGVSLLVRRLSPEILEQFTNNSLIPFRKIKNLHVKANQVFPILAIKG